MISDILTVLGLVLFWALVSAVCFRVFPCPEALQPSQNKGKKTKNYYNYYGNYVSICHAVMTTLLALYLVLTEGITLGEKNTPLINFIVFNSLAYFLYDTGVSEYYRYNSVPMTFHHLTSILVFSIVMYLQNSGNEVGLALLLAEMSNPFNLARDILKHYRMENTKQFFYISVTFAALFIITRFIFIPIQLAIIYPGPTHIAVKLLAGTMWFISWHWFFVILNLMCKEVRDFLRKSDKKDGIWGPMYVVATQLRKNKLFLGSFYATAAFLSFGTLYLTHKNAPRPDLTQ